MGIFIGTKEEMLSGWEGVREVPQLRVIFSDLMSEKWCQYTPSQLAAGTRGGLCQTDSCREVLCHTWIRHYQGQFLGLDYSCPNSLAMLPKFDVQGQKS